MRRTSNAASVRWLPLRVLFFFFVRYALLMPFLGLVCGALYGGVIAGANDSGSMGLIALGLLVGATLGLQAGLQIGIAIGLLTGILSAICYFFWMPGRTIARAGCWLAPAIALCAIFTPLWRTTAGIGLQTPFANVIPTLIAIIATWLVSRMIGGQFAARF